MLQSVCISFLLSQELHTVCKNAEECGTFPIQFDSQFVSPQKKVLFLQMICCAYAESTFFFLSTEVLQICFVLTEKSVPPPLIIIDLKCNSIVDAQHPYGTYNL